MDRGTITAASIREPPRIFNNIWSSLKIRCQNLPAGCQRVVNLNDLESHEQECPFGLVDCELRNCTAQVQRRHLLDHMRTCGWRMVLCKHGCGHKFPFNTAAEHYARCHQLPVQCEHCGLTLQQEEMAAHIEYHCPKTKIQCTMGCAAKVIERLLLRRACT